MGCEFRGGLIKVPGTTGPESKLECCAKVAEVRDVRGAREMARGIVATLGLTNKAAE